MNTNLPLPPHLFGDMLPKFADTHFINAAHSSRHTILPHAHSGLLELYFICSGTNHYMVNNRFYELKKGDLVICNADTLHGENLAGSHSSRTYSVGIADVRAEGLPENHLCSDSERPVLETGLLADQIEALFSLIYVLSADLTRQRTTCDSLCCSLLLLTYEMLQSRKRSMPADPPSATLAEKIQEYIDRHYREHLSLAAISRSVGVSESRLSHIFRGAFGVPPIQYMMERRIGEAEQLLMNTEIPVGDIARRLGFGSFSHFSTMFSQYVGIAPGKFRKSLKEMAEE